MLVGSVWSWVYIALSISSIVARSVAYGVLAIDHYALHEHAHARR